MSVVTAKRLLNKKLPVKVLKSRKNELWEHKEPKGSQPHVGIEIEFYTSATEEKVFEVFAKLGLQNHVCIGEDGSIHPPDVEDDGIMYFGYEVVICAPESQIKRVLNRVSDALKLIDARTNESCGLHVHIDHREATKRNPLISFNNLVRVQDFLFKVVDPERSDNDFCQKVETKDFIAHLFRQIDDDDRYYAINALALEKHKTIEVRLFHSTIDAEEIYHYVQMVLAAVKSKKISENIRVVSQLKKIKKVPKDTRQYLAKKQRSGRRAA